MKVQVTKEFLTKNVRPALAIQHQIHDEAAEVLFEIRERFYYHTLRHNVELGWIARNIFRKKPWSYAKLESEAKRRAQETFRDDFHPLAITALDIDRQVEKSLKLRYKRSQELIGKLATLEKAAAKADTSTPFTMEVGAFNLLFSNIRDGFEVKVVDHD